MHQTQPEGGETIFEIFGPHDSDKYKMSEVHVVDEIGSFEITEEE